MVSWFSVQTASGFPGPYIPVFAFTFFYSVIVFSGVHSALSAPVRRTFSGEL